MKALQQIGIPLYQFTGKGIKTKIVNLLKRHGFSQSYSVGEDYLSVNFIHKCWFTHVKNLYYPDMIINDIENPLHEIKQLITTH